jgi:hypothetical protein
MLLARCWCRSRMCVRRAVARAVPILPLLPLVAAVRLASVSAFACACGFLSTSSYVIVECHVFPTYAHSANTHTHTHTRHDTHTHTRTHTWYPSQCSLLCTCISLPPSPRHSSHEHPPLPDLCFPHLLSLLQTSLPYIYSPPFRNLLSLVGSCVQSDPTRAFSHLL